ncbi:MAG: hypothetical protein RL338_543 [Chloroflexota bacterium]|jgi:hypothetical protein
MTFEPVDALVTDRYLDALLEAGERRAFDAPSDARLDPALRRTARRLSGGLVRIHPSFRFEERLAARLAEAAIALRDARPSLSDARPAPRDARPSLSVVPAAGDDRTLSPFPGGPEPGLLRAAPSRRLVVGGAIVSALLSLVGAVLVAWWRGRSGASGEPALDGASGRTAEGA